MLGASKALLFFEAYSQGPLASAALLSAPLGQNPLLQILGSADGEWEGGAFRCSCWHLLGYHLRFGIRINSALPLESLAPATWLGSPWGLSYLTLEPLLPGPW